MHILILSDTHGDLSRASNVIKKLQKQHPLDLIIHCGDYYHDGTWLNQRTGIPTVCVKGNSDGSFSYDEYAIVDTEYGSLLVTHGHMEQVGFSQQNLYYKAQEKGCCAAIYGHTHRAVFTETGGIYLLNPGSLTQPRDGSGGTFGLIVTGPEYFRGYIHRYEDFMAAGDGDAGGGPGQGGSGDGKGGRDKGAKVKGGYLRKLLNYSDRF